MKKRQRWYVLAYDVRDPKRLRRTHAHIKKHGISLQKSVFLIHADSKALARLKAGVLARVDKNKDDVRLYPIRHPGVLWAAGRQENKMDSLYAPAPEKKPRGLPNRIRSLFSWKST